MDLLIATAIGGLLALAGVLVTSLISIRREKLQRQWSMQDNRRQHQLSVLERRLVQSESYVEAMTSDLRSVMHEAEFYLGSSDPQEAKRINRERTALKQSIDTKVFAQGPAIRSLGDEQLSKLWPELIAPVERVGSLYMEIFHRKFEKGESIDASHYASHLSAAWLEYSGSLGFFYQRLDGIRRESFDTYSE